MQYEVTVVYADGNIVRFNDINIDYPNANKICLKQIHNKTEDTKRFYAKMYNKFVYNPSNQVDISYNNKNWKLNLIPENVYNLLLKFYCGNFTNNISFHRESILRKAERLL